VDPKIESDQVARLAAFRAARDAKTAQNALERLERDASEDRNLMPGILEAVCSRATLGEVVGSLKRVYGEHRPGG
jgi:methylmalonyl-CoA mutase N-terminal domain/subunit